MLSIIDAVPADTFMLEIFTSAGVRVMTQRFTGSATSFYLPEGNGMLIMRVSGDSLNAIAKFAL